MPGPRGPATAIAVALAAASPGCSLLVELIEPDGAAAGADARAPTSDCATWTFAPAGVDPCQLPPPSGALVIGDGAWTFDTNSGALTDPDQDVTFPASALLTPADGPELRVVSVDGVSLSSGAELQVIGKRPLLLVSWSSAEVRGGIAATSRPGAPAAGADPAACAPARAGASDVEGGGGGGGGGLGAPGGAGGTGDAGLAGAGPGGAAAARPIPVRGGCAGAAGGDALAGAGGSGGGAVYLAARERIALDGVIAAGGAGGGAAQGGRSGGGGGGAGGFVGLAAPAIVVGPAAIVAANGGGGGGGCDGSPALLGQDGQATTTAAAAGAGQGMGASGGAGGARATPAIAGGNARRGGGGGGGGVGWIVIASADRQIAAGAVISPDPQP